MASVSSQRFTCLSIARQWRGRVLGAIYVHILVASVSSARAAGELDLQVHGTVLLQTHGEVVAAQQRNLPGEGNWLNQHEMERLFTTKEIDDMLASGNALQRPSVLNPDETEYSIVPKSQGCEGVDCEVSGAHIASRKAVQHVTASRADVRSLLEVHEKKIAFLPLKHKSGKCVRPADHSENPADGVQLVFHHDCSAADALLKAPDADGEYHVLMHKSGLCAYTGRDGVSLVYRRGCEDTDPASRMMAIPDGAGYFVLKHKKTGRCVHSSNGGETIKNNDKLILQSGCGADSNVLHFRFGGGAVATNAQVEQPRSESPVTGAGPQPTLGAGKDESKAGLTHASSTGFVQEDVDDDQLVAGPPARSKDEQAKIQHPPRIIPWPIIPWPMSESSPDTELANAAGAQFPQPKTAPQYIQEDQEASTARSQRHVAAAMPQPKTAPVQNGKQAGVASTPAKAKASMAEDRVTKGAQQQNGLKETPKKTVQVAPAHGAKKPAWAKAARTASVVRVKMDRLDNHAEAIANALKASKVSFEECRIDKATLRSKNGRSMDPKKKPQYADYPVTLMIPIVRRQQAPATNPVRLLQTLGERRAIPYPIELLGQNITFEM